ncbi:hypothetical protein TESG_08012 [Trichophyton tonsurans CBS 112818]|uniref:Uncharacterized protein n=1 Tax=Trichophyton tonsurans (strain CBS 112818) TaxID=647933 RepID=F2SAW8_TRIT1|nr:hypothetical protein TESG_08012 [Trichophyton tonsurans CBS 112818]
MLVGLSPGIYQSRQSGSTFGGWIEVQQDEGSAWKRLGLTRFHSAYPDPNTVYNVYPNGFSIHNNLIGQNLHLGQPPLKYARSVLEDIKDLIQKPPTHLQLSKRPSKKMEASKSSKFITFKPLPSYVKAMHNCLLQLCDQKSFICLFRIKSDVQLRFNGRITWKPYQRCISWSELLLNKASNKIQIYEYSVEFSTSAEGSDEEEVISAYYHHFIQFCEHRDRLKQYAQIK